jgi:hypothetical protein
MSTYFSKFNGVKEPFLHLKIHIYFIIPHCCIVSHTGIESELNNPVGEHHVVFFHFSFYKVEMIIPPSIWINVFLKQVSKHYFTHNK